MGKLINVYKFGGQKIRTGQIIALRMPHLKAGQNVGGQRRGILFALKDGIVVYQTVGRAKRKRTYVSVKEINNG